MKKQRGNRTELLPKAVKKIEQLKKEVGQLSFINKGKRATSYEGELVVTTAGPFKALENKNPDNVGIVEDGDTPQTNVW